MTECRYDPLKRAIDIVVSTVGLVLSAPLQACIALLVRRNLGTPVLFRQLRPGKDGEIFELVKFRTMKDVNHASGLLTDEDRLTPFGAVLRSTSLDELPTFWNVLRGQMSLVGPRPLLVEYLQRYPSHHHRRHEVRPGITGLAQVSGRNALSWEERLDLDVEYVDRRSLALDFRILVRTIRATVRREGIAAEGHVTMAEYLGPEGREE